MYDYEILLDTALACGTEVIENYPILNGRIKGLYCDGVIALSEHLETMAEKRCVLAEELGHHQTSAGDITDLSITRNRKQELKARLWGYRKILGLTSIIDAYNARCENVYEAAEYLGVSEWYLKEALTCYRSIYGAAPVPVGAYDIRFVPNLLIMRRKYA